MNLHALGSEEGTHIGSRSGSTCPRRQLQERTSSLATKARFLFEGQVIEFHFAHRLTPVNRKKFVGAWRGLAYGYNAGLLAVV